MERNRQLQLAVPLLLALGVMLLAACTPGTSTAGTGRGFAFIWYIALDGDDDNSCIDSTDACATLSGVLQKAEDQNTRLEGEYEDLYRVDHTINIAAGTYFFEGPREGYPIGSVNLNATIVGQGEGSTILDSANTYGGIAVNADVELTIRNLTIQNANGTAIDSCVNVRGPSEVTLEHVTLTHCVRAGIAYPGFGMLTLRNVTSTGNIPNEGGNGAGAIMGGPAAVEDSTFSYNEGMGIISYGDELAIRNSVVIGSGSNGIQINGGNARLVNVQMDNNGQDGGVRSGLVVGDGATVAVQGGSMSANQQGALIRDPGTVVTFDNTVVSENPRTGIIVGEGAQLTIENSVVNNNGASYAGTDLTGALSSEGRVVIHDSQFNGNQNGGLYNNSASGELHLSDAEVTNNVGGLPAVYNGPEATMVIQRSLIANNTINAPVTSESALENRGEMLVVNTTVSGNNKNGVQASSGSLEISYSTITENGQIGLNAFTGGSVVSSVTNTIIAKNPERDCAISSGPSGVPLPTTGVNIDTDGMCGFSSTYSPADIRLGSLADNGGPTMTHALLPGSPARDAATGSCPSGDQRNAMRPFGPACDLGAYEAGSVALSLEGGDVELATATPASTLGILIAIPDQNYNCREGNSTLFEIADTLKQGGEFTPVGIGADKAWFQFEGPTYGQLCWAPAQGFSLYLDGKVIQPDELPDGLLNTVVYPQEPTATPDIDESYDTTPTPTPTCAPNDPKCP